MELLYIKTNGITKSRRRGILGMLSRQQKRHNTAIAWSMYHHLVGNVMDVDQLLVPWGSDIQLEDTTSRSWVTHKFRH
jgi:hypothetical protein